jgi:hypothetical protein
MDAEMWFVVVGAFLVVLIPFALYCRIRYGHIWPKGKWTDGLTIGFITYVVVKITLKYYIFPRHPPRPPVVEQSAETQTEFGDDTAVDTTSKIIDGKINPNYIPQVTGRAVPGGGSGASIDFLNDYQKNDDGSFTPPDDTPIPLEPNVDPK